MTALTNNRAVQKHVQLQGLQGQSLNENVLDHSKYANEKTLEIRLKSVLEAVV